MSFLIDLFKKARKGDAYRPTETPDKYADRIAALNAGGQSTQSNTKITTANVAKISNGFIPSDNNLGKLPSA
jgi:hypothetical protein